MSDLRTIFAKDLANLVTALPVAVSLAADGPAIVIGSWQTIRDDTIFQQIGASREDVRQILVPVADFTPPPRNTKIYCDGVPFLVHEVSFTDTIAAVMTLLKVQQ